MPTVPLGVEEAVALVLVPRDCTAYPMPSTTAKTTTRTAATTRVRRRRSARSCCARISAARAAAAWDSDPPGGGRPLLGHLFTSSSCATAYVRGARVSRGARDRFRPGAVGCRPPTGCGDADQPGAEQQQAHVAGDLPGVVAGGVRVVPAVAEAAAVDRDAARPHRGDPDDERELQQCRDATGEAGQQPEDQARADEHLHHRQGSPHDVGDRRGQQLVGPHGGHAGLRVRDLEQSRPQPHTADHEPGTEPGPAQSGRVQHPATVGRPGMTST